MKPTATLLTLLGLLAPCLRGTETITASTPDATSRPFRIITAEPAHFPFDMYNRAVRQGTVRLMLDVDATGKLVDLLVTSASQTSFAVEAERVARLWKFEPTVEQGRPIGTLVGVTFNFEVSGVIVTELKYDGASRLAALAGPEKPDYEAVELKQLDRIPTPVKLVSPDYPQEWANRGITGRIVVDFYIDETGKARMASCPAGTDPRLAGIALTAVRHWEFTPPTLKGQPVLVRAQQVFQFLGKS